MTDGNAMAFARPAYQYASGAYDAPIDGVTKREYFAALAMQGMVSKDGSMVPGYDRSKTAGMAVEYADALIAALNKT